MPSLPTTIPHGRTARRLEWAHLPPRVRAAVEARCGAPVVDAVSQGAGFTPGFASVLSCADGSRHFVKAASTVAQRPFATAYREEARKLAALPDGVPAPRLEWVLDEEWVVLGIEYVEATSPRRPWSGGDLTRTLDALEDVAQVLTPVPAGLELDAAPEEHATWPEFWEALRGRPDLPAADEAHELAAGFAEVVEGDTVVHFDVRDDNVLLCADGRTLFCDWNWPVRGAAWLDSLVTLIGPRGDGLEVEVELRRRPLLRDVPADHVDRVLALVCGYFLASAEQPVPPSSPYVRDAQRWQGRVVWDWLSERRGWG